MAMKTKKAGRKDSRKAERRRSQRRAAKSRPAEGAQPATTGPYRDFQRDYASALWL
jgi:hypothetical protein